MMSPQSEGRLSTERPQQAQESNYGSRPSQRQKPSDPTGRNPSQATNEPESFEVAKQRFVGLRAADDDRSNGTLPLSPSDGRNGRETEVSQDIPVRVRSRTDGSTGGNTSGGASRLCTKCGESLSGKYVRALKGTFHLACFMCQVSLTTCM